MQVRKVLYCPECSLPPEYCEFGPCFERCKVWLVQNCPDLYPELAEDEELKKQVEALKLAEGKKGRGGALKAGEDVSDEDEELEEEEEEDEEGEEEEEEKQDSVNKDVLIWAVARTKRKNVTIVKGIEKHGLKLKDVLKPLKNKFACGCSIHKPEDKSAQEAILIQGDVEYDLPEFLVKKFKIPKNKIFIYDPKTKSKEPADFM